ncbi:pre-peptidase C-terminal domain-containing protein [Anaerosporobacter sp.]
MKMKLSSILLAFALLVSCIFGTNTAQAAIVYDESYAEVTELTTVVATTGTEADLGKTVTYALQTSMENEVVPINIPTKGYLDFFVASNVASSDVSIYTDESCTVKAGSSAYISSYGEPIQEGVYGDDGYAYFSKKGTYYVKFETPGTYTFTSQMYNGANRTLKNDTYTTAYSYAYDTYNYDSKSIYYKYKASKTGYISISTDFLSDYGNATITLCNSKKKAISEDVYVSKSYNDKTVFAVKKGVTYYVKVTSSSEVYRIKSKITGVTEKSGNRKTKAKTLAIGKVAKGVVLSEDKTSLNDWYMFKLTKATKLKLTVAGNSSSGDLRVELTSPNLSGSVDLRINSVGYKTSTSLKTYTTSTLPKGTYYIRVYKDDKKSSGSYALKVSKR